MTSTVKCVLIFVLLSSIRPFAQDVARSERMEQIMQSHVSAGTFIGAVLVARDGAVIFDKAYGMANIELDVPNTPDTKFRLGSLTKQFTAAAILVLVDRGRLKLEDPVKTHLPDAPAAWDRVTVFNLLTHTSGIPNFTALPDYRTIKLSARTPSAAVAAVSERPLDFAPGETMRYSNTGYAVLGAIIEHVSGQTYEQFVNDSIFAPLGMKDSGYDSNTAIIKRRASGYTRGSSGFINAGYIHMTVPYAAGALYSTTRDLLKWQQGLFSGRVVSKGLVDRMTTPFKDDYGLGVVPLITKGRRVIWHNGGIDGFNTSMAYFPDTRTVVIVLSNVNSPVPDQAASQLGALMHGDSVTLPSERKEVALPPSTLARYAGTYERSGVIMTVAVDDGRLVIQPAAQAPRRIFPLNPTLFFAKDVDLQVMFAADGTSLVIQQNFRDQKWTRRAPRTVMTSFSTSCTSRRGCSPR